MIKYFLYLSLGMITFNSSFAQNIDIQEDIKIGFACELEKKYLKTQNIIIRLF